MNSGLAFSDESDTTDSSSEARPPILAVDMDETIIQSDTEELIPGARDALLALRELGWKIIVWTCRGDISGHTREILERHDIPYDAINENLKGLKHESRKIIFDAVVDNKNVDFGNGWESIVRELETRREGWRSKGITKAIITKINPETKQSEIVHIWKLQKNGGVILEKGSIDDLEIDVDVSPKDGLLFLKALEESYNTSFLCVSLK